MNGSEAVGHCREDVADMVVMDGHGLDGGELRRATVIECISVDG